MQYGIMWMRSDMLFTHCQWALSHILYIDAYSITVCGIHTLNKHNTGL